MLPQGKGIWIWRVEDCEGGDVGKIVAKANAAGLGHLLVKVCDGVKAYNAAHVEGLVGKARTAGIQVIGWVYTYGHDEATEAQIGAGLLTPGMDGLVVDAEGEYEGSPVAAGRYMEALRKCLPKATIGLSSFWSVSLHEEFPWAQFLDKCDYVMPQVYWAPEGGSKRPAIVTLQRSLQELAVFGKPIVPTAGDADVDAFAAIDLAEFMGTAKGARCQAVNVWHWAGMQAAIWDMLRNVPWANSTGPPATGRPASWAREAWDWAKADGLMDGTEPQRAVTREELAVVLKRMGERQG